MVTVRLRLGLIMRKSKSTLFIFLYFRHVVTRLKLSLNRLANYIPGGWRPDYGCPECLSEKVEISGNQKVTIALFIDGQTPFLQNMLNRVSSLDYDQQYLSIFVYNNHESNELHIKNWLLKMKYHYQTVKVINAEDKIKITNVKKMALR